MHKYENLEKKWFFYKIKRFFIIYLAPILVVIAGVAIYFWLIYSVHPDEKNQSSSHQPQQEKEIKRLPMGPGPVIIPEKQLEKIEAEENRTKANLLPANTTTDDANTTDANELNATQAATPEEQKEPEEPQSLKGKQCYKVAVPALNIRSKPTTSSRVIGKAQLGDIVCEEERAGDWIRTKEGWAYGRNFISPLPEKYKPFKEVEESEPKKLTPLPETKNEAPIKIDMTSTTVDPRTKLAEQKADYEASPSYQKALKVAETYYIMQDYASSKDWALKANDMNADDPGSWVVFAKSLDKLGKKREAINVLGSYLKTHDSVEAETLLKNLGH